MASQVALALRLKKARKKAEAEANQKLQIRQEEQQLKQLSPRKLQTTWNDEASEVSAMVTESAGDGAADAAAADHRLRAAKAYKKWMQKHRNHSLGMKYNSQSGLEDYETTSSKSDVILWLGLAVLVTGTVISFIGLGEKGFRTRQLRLLGPILVCSGLSLCAIRIALCCADAGPAADDDDDDDDEDKKEFFTNEQLAIAVRFQHAVALQFSRFDDAMPAIRVDQAPDAEADAEAKLLDVVIDIDDDDPEYVTTTAVIENSPPELLLSVNRLKDDSISSTI